MTCSTIMGYDRKYKILYISILNGVMKQEGIKARFVEIDLVSCHAGVLCYLFPEKTKLFTRIFAENLSLWGEIISHIPKQIIFIIEKKTEPKKIVKIVAYKILHSGLSQLHSILKAIDHYLMDLTLEEKNTVVEALRQNPVLDEFRTLFKEVFYRIGMQNCQIYSMFQTKPLCYANLSDPKNIHLKRINDQKKENKNVFEHGGINYTTNAFRMCSSIFVGVEQLLLCGLTSVLFELKLGVPISFEHDGCLCLVDESRGKIDLSVVNKRFAEFLYERTKISNLRLELKSLEF